MVDKTFRGALEDTKKVAREAAAKAREAMEPGLKAVREAAGKIREQLGPSHLPRVDRAAHTVQGDHCLYEIQETKRGNGQDGSYSVHRKGTNGDKEQVGSFDVTDRTLSVRGGEKVAISEIALIAAAWIAPPPATSVAPPDTSPSAS
jgi:hypothetical protein